MLLCVQLKQHHQRHVVMPRQPAPRLVVGQARRALASWTLRSMKYRVHAIATICADAANARQRHHIKPYLRRSAERKWQHAWVKSK